MPFKKREMGTLKLYIGSRGSYYHFKDKALEHLSGDDAESFLYILPVNRSVRYLKKKLTAEANRRSIVNPQVHTFRTFVRDIYRHFPDQKKIIPPSIRLLFLQYILNIQEPQLQYFQSQGSFGNSLILKSDQMLEEFFQFGFGPGELKEPPLTAENKFNDFSLLINSLFDIYQSNLIDESSLINEALVLINDVILKEIFPKLQVAYISGFGIYSPPMFELVNSLKKICDVQIKLEYSSENEELFKHTSNAYERLSRMSDQIVELKDDFTAFSQNLFNPTKVTDEVHNFPVTVEINRFYSRVDEIGFIATKIKELHHQKGIPLHKIGITFPDLEKYVPFIKKTFNDFQLPFNLSTGFNLAESPLIQTFMQVLRIVISGFQTTEVFKLAISPFLRKQLTEEANLIRQTARKIRLNYLQGNWEERIRRTVIPPEDESIIPTSGRITEDQLEIMIENISHLLETIHPLTEKQPAENFMTVYIRVLKNLGLLDWYQHDHADLEIFDKEKEFRAFNRFIKLMDQVIWALKYIHGNDPLEIREYVNNLTLVFENVTYNLREWSDYGVQIMPRLEILSLDLETLFIGGLVEGDFPRHFSRDIFFNDEERAEIGLNASEDLISQDRFLFFQLLACGAHNIQFSYPQLEADAKLLPSTFLTDLVEMVPIEEKNTSIIDKFISRSSLPEHLSKSLKSDLNDADLYLYKSWRNYEAPQKIGYWFEGVRSLYKKRSYREITRYEGNLSESGAVNLSLRETHLKRPFSITALESYAFCPMQYFLQRILNLDVEEEIEATISSLEKGNLIHKILYEFYSHLKPDERLKPWESGDALKSIAKDMFQTLPYSDILWYVEKEKYFGGPLGSGLWDSFLRTEKEYLEQTHFIPSLFESTFGYLKGSDTDQAYTRPLVIKNDKKDIKIYGKIDRIDIDKKGRFNVIDYKSGQGAMKTKIADILAGTSLQLPVYIMAANQILKKKRADVMPASGMYYQVQDADNCRTKFVLINQASGITSSDSRSKKQLDLKAAGKSENFTFEEILEKSADHISGYFNRLSNGNFQHTTSPNDTRCASYCAFRRICRKDTSKLIALQE
jgi:ATP-dependent helicase/DNAse subunit B